MKDNSGFSLVELLVVMAMMAILLSVGLTVFGLSDNGYVKENTQNLTAMLEKAVYNTQAIAAKEWVVEVTKVDDNYVASLSKVTTDDVGNLVTEEVESLDFSGNVKVTLDSMFEGAGALSDKEITEIDNLVITFEKQTGEVSKLTVGSTDYDKAELKGNKGTITVISGNKEKTIEIFWSTGKIFTK